MKNRKHLMTSTLAILAVCIGSAIAQPPGNPGQREQTEEQQRSERRGREENSKPSSERQAQPRVERAIERVQERVQERTPAVERVREQRQSPANIPSPSRGNNLSERETRVESEPTNRRAIESIRNRQAEPEKETRNTRESNTREVQIEPVRTPRIEREQPVRTPRPTRQEPRENETAPSNTGIRVIEDAPNTRENIRTPRVGRDIPTRQTPNREVPKDDANSGSSTPVRTPSTRDIPVRTPTTDIKPGSEGTDRQPEGSTQPVRPVRPGRDIKTPDQSPDRETGKDVNPTLTPVPGREPVSPINTPNVGDDTRPNIRPTPDDRNPNDVKPDETNPNQPAQPGERLPGGRDRNPGSRDNQPGKPDDQSNGPGATPSPTDGTKPDDGGIRPDGGRLTPNIGRDRLPRDVAPPISRLPKDLPNIPGATVPDPDGRGQLKPENFRDMVNKSRPEEQRRSTEREGFQKKNLENFDRMSKEFGGPNKLPRLSENRLKIDREKPALIGSFVQPKGGRDGRDWNDRVLTGRSLDERLANIPNIKTRDRDYREEDFDLLRRGDRGDRRWKDLRDDDWRRPFNSSWHQDYYKVRRANNINININIFGPAYLPPPPPRPGYGVDYTSFRWNYWDGRSYYDSSYVLGLNVKLGHRRISGYDGYLVGGRYYCYGYGWIDGCIDYGDSRIWVPGYYRTYTVEECGTVPVWLAPTYEWVWTGCCWEEVQVGGGYFVNRPAGCNLVTRHVWVPGHYQYYRV